MGIRRFAGPILLVVFLCLMLWFYMSSNKEAFGATSPGTMIQLSTSHVPTEEEVETGGRKYREQVEHDLAAMTY